MKRQQTITYWELRNRHRRSKVQNEGSAPGHPQGAVEETAAGDRTSGTAGHEGQTTGGLQSDSVLRKKSHASEQLRYRQPAVSWQSSRC